MCLLWRAWDFHPSHPAEELELDESAGAWFGTRRKPKQFTRESWVVKEILPLAFAISFTPEGGSRCLWCLGAFVAGLWPKESETATSVPWRTAADKNGVCQSVRHVVYFWYWWSRWLMDGQDPPSTILILVRFTKGSCSVSGQPPSISCTVGALWTSTVVSLHTVDICGKGYQWSRRVLKWCSLAGKHWAPFPTLFLT